MAATATIAMRAAKPSQKATSRRATSAVFIAALACRGARGATTSREPPLEPQRHTAAVPGETVREAAGERARDADDLARAA